MRCTYMFHVCNWGETRGRINLVRATPSICSPPKIDSITRRAKYPVEKYPTKKYPIENSGAKFERNGCLWCRSREIVHLSLGIDMELIQLPIIWTDVEPSNHKNYFFSLSLSKNIVNWDLGHWEHNFTLFCDIAFWTEYGLFKVGSFGCYTIHLDFLSGMNASCYDHNLRS